MAAASICPILQDSGLEFCAVIHGDGASLWSSSQDAIKHSADRLSRHPKSFLEHGTMPAPGIDDRQDSKRSPIRESIMHKIHAPALGGARWNECWATMQGDMFPSSHQHPKLQPLLINSAAALVSNSQTNPHAGATPRSVDTPIEVGHALDPECTDEGRSDP